MAISALGTLGAGVERETTFTGILTLTHNATSLILPGAANIVTAAGDVARWRSLGSGNWKCVGYERASGAPISNTLTQPTLTLKQSAAPTPTAEGDIQWDTDDNILLIGDGAAAQTFVPFPASVVAGDLFYATSAKALTRLAKGTAGQALLMNVGATAPSWATLPFTKSFTSAQQTITSGGALTIPHSLGVSPPLVIAVFQCLTADNGYVTGNEVTIGIGKSDGSPDRGFGVFQDATNLNVVFGTDVAPIEYKHGTTGANCAFTSSRWRLVLRAYA